MPAPAVYNRLYQPDRGETEPGRRWPSVEISDDGTEYTFKLRKGVKFQTTEDFTPAATSTPMTWSSPSSASAMPTILITKGFRRQLRILRRLGPAALIKSIEKVDDITVKVTLNNPDAPSCR